MTADDRFYEIDDEGTGVEQEDVAGDEPITDPFDPSLIRVTPKFLTIGQLLDRIAEGALDLSPDFQRKFVWDEGAQSRLIESTFVRLPLPAFYMDATDDDCWLVIDGLQRLTSLKKFALTKELKLSELEFLKEHQDKIYDEIPASLKRRLKETQVVVYLIEKGTPIDVKFNIFKRINTGGLPLSAQEIRHALNQGEVTEFLARLANSPEFEQATDSSVKGKRMEDREMALRFLAFSRTPYTTYSTSDLDSFLNKEMAQFNEILKDETAQQHWEQRFKRAMNAAYRIFDNDAFRKRYDPDARRLFINKALFDTWSVNLDKLDDNQLERLIRRREQVRSKFIELMNTPEFNNAISQGTGNVRKVKLRFKEVESLIAEVLQ